MLKLLRFVLFAVIGLVALIVLAGVLVALFFDPNDYRDRIAAELSDATGREFTLEGDLNLKVFPWLSVATGRVTMANAPGFGPEPMMTLESASGAVRLLPLLSGTVEIGRVSIEGLSLSLAVDEAGRTSWADFEEESADDGPGDVGEGAGEPGLLKIESVSLSDASIRYADRQSGDAYRMENLSIDIDRVDPNAPIPVRAAFDFALEPAGTSGKVSIGTVARFAGFGPDESLAVTLSDFRIDGDVSIPDLGGAHPFAVRSDSISIDVGSSALALTEGAFEFDELRGRMGLEGTYAPVKLTGPLTLERFSPRALMTALAIDPPETTDDGVLRRVSGGGTLSLTDTSAALSNAQVELDDSRLTGSVMIENFSAPAYAFSLELDAIDLDRYLPPAEDPSVAADAGDTAAETALPVDLIRGMTATGDLKVKRLTLGDLPFDGLELGLSAGGDQLRLSPMRATVLDGNYEGDVRIDARQPKPRLSVDERIIGLDLGKLASLMWERDNVSGTLGGRFTLAGRGQTLSEIRTDLDGNITFELADGALLGTDLWYQIRRARALFKQQPVPPAPSPARTEFSTVRGTASVNDGIASNDDLFAELPFLQLTGKGKVDLGSGTVDYGLRARVLERPEFLTGATAEELDEYTEAVIPLRITGPVAAPSVKPDISALARSEVERKIDKEKDRIRDRLLDRLGVPKEEEAAPADGTEDGEAAPEEEEVDPEEELKKKLRDLLGG